MLLLPINLKCHCSNIPQSHKISSETSEILDKVPKMTGSAYEKPKLTHHVGQGDVGLGGRGLDSAPGEEECEYRRGRDNTSWRRHIRQLPVLCQCGISQSCIWKLKPPAFLLFKMNNFPRRKELEVVGSKPNGRLSHMSFS